LMVIAVVGLVILMPLAGELGKRVLNAEWKRGPQRLVMRVLDHSR